MSADDSDSVLFIHYIVTHHDVCILQYITFVAEYGKHYATHISKLATPHLQDELVQLVPLQPSDFTRLYAVAADPLIWEQHPSKDRYQEPVFREFFDQALTSQGAFLFIEKATGEIIGSSRYYDYNVRDSSVAIGYTFLARKYWGGQYNRSAKIVMMNYAFGIVDKIIFHIGATNLRSQIATSRFGAIKTNEFSKETPAGISVHYEYAVLKKDWNA